MTRTPATNLVQSALALLLLSSSALAATPPSQNNNNPSQKSQQGQKKTASKDSKKLDKAIHQYISNHPELIYETLVKYQKQQATKQKTQINDFIKQNSKMLFDSQQDGVLGNPKGTTTIMMMSDYNCGYCKKASQILAKMIAKNPNLRVVVKQLPILGQDSNNAARIAMLAQKKHLFAKVDKALVAMDKPMTKDKLITTAAKFGITKQEVEKALSSKDLEKEISENYTLASKLAIQGTPALIITNKDRSKVQFIENFMNEAELQKLILTNK